MAWFQNLAGRAEDLLNKIDKNAATVLNDSNSKVLDEGSSFLASEKYEEISIGNEIPINDNSLNDSQNNESIFSGEVYDIENLRQEFSGVEDKKSNPSSRSLSSHNSFVLNEDIQAYNEKITRLEQELQDLNQQFLNLQHLYAELRNENSNLLSQIESSNYLAATANSEMEQYKARAQRILQEKEDLIALKSENKSQNNDHILVNYNDELKKELEFQQSKNVELNEKIKKLSNEVSYFQQQIVSTQRSSQQTLQGLEENLALEKRNRQIAEDDCRQRSHELLTKIQELSQQSCIIQVQNEEIKQLQEVVKRKTDANLTKDVELRIKSLTETLMLKQSNLEQITTERNALRIQLEKLETKYHNNLIQLQHAQIRVVNVNDTDDVKSQVPQFLKMSPLDAGVTRRVKHAYSTVDSISIRTGKFLRRYPLARVIVFCYMILLHFWALILLFLYAPSTR